MTRPRERVQGNEAERQALRAVSNLDRRSWRNWYLFLAVAVVTMLGLGSAFVALSRGRFSTPWPWVNTELMLTVGLAITVLLFAGYLTQQQRQVVALRRELLKVHQESARRARSHYERLVALLGVSRVLATETNPQTVFDSITRTCLHTFECEQSTLMLCDDAKQELQVRSVCGHEEGSSELSSTRKLGEGIAGWVAQARTPLILTGGAAPELPAFLREGTPLPVAAMVVPIALRGQLIGVLSVSSGRRDLRYEEEDLQALQVFAESAGVCCRHAEQTDWMRQTIQRLDATLQERGTNDSEWAA